VDLPEHSIVSFTPDHRFRSVHFRADVGTDEVRQWSLRFIGWAVVVGGFDPATGSPNTRIVPVGLTDVGDPVTAHALEQQEHLPTGRVRLAGYDLPDDWGYPPGETGGYA
jgi:hypothetical protein